MAEIIVEHMGILLSAFVITGSIVALALAIKDRKINDLQSKLWLKESYLSKERRDSNKAFADLNKFVAINKELVEENKDLKYALHQMREEK